MAAKGINECIRGLWKNKFFISPRTPKEIKEEIFYLGRIAS